MRRLLAVLGFGFALSLPAQQAMGVADPEIAAATVKPSDPEAKDELFTIRGSHIATVNTPVVDLLKYAYGLNARQIVGLNDALANRRFDLDAVADAPGVPNNAQMQAMVRRVLVSRFHLRFHHEDREAAVFVLTVVGAAPKMERTKRLTDAPTDLYGSGGVLHVNNASMQDFATGLSRGLVDRPVVDQTGLKDRYDFVLRWTFLGSQPEGADAPPDLFTAIQEELGLRLRAAKLPLEMMVVDGMDLPSRN